MHSDNCVACHGDGVRPKWSDRHSYRYFVAIYHEVWPLFDETLEEAHGPLPNDQYTPTGLKYNVFRSPMRQHGEKVTGGVDGWAECLTSCGRFTKYWLHGRTFASDREADRMVERLASGLPVFITRAVAVAITLGVVAPT